MTLRTMLQELCYLEEQQKRVTHKGGPMLALIAALALSQTPEQTTQYIQSLKPEINPRYARKLGYIIDFWAKKFDVDPNLMVVILRVESYFEPNIKACWPAPWKGPREITCDHGLAQINEVWIQQWSLDAQKLVSDDSYNIYVQARLLSWLQKNFSALEPDWYGRYHSSIPEFKERYLAKLAFFGYIK